MFFGSHSDCFFVAQVWLTSIAHDDEFDVFIALVIFGFSCLFLILPMLINLFQLQKEIKTWLADSDTRQMLQSWITNNIMLLYALSIIFGSSFSAIEFCNSNLFQWPICYMSLPRKYKQVFKHKRLHSVVYFENIPQFALQIFFSIYFNDLTFITLFAMIFSLLSVILALFEFSIKQYLFENETLLLIKFKVESKQIQNLSRSQFQHRIEYKRFGVSNEIAKILSIDFSSIELLKPIPSKEGALLIFHIRNDSIDGTNALKTIQKEIHSGRLGTALNRIYKLEDFPKILGLETKFIGSAATGGIDMPVISIPKQNKAVRSASSLSNLSNNSPRLVQTSLSVDGNDIGHIATVPTVSTTAGMTHDGNEVDEMAYTMGTPGTDNGQMEAPQRLHQQQQGRGEGEGHNEGEPPLPPSRETEYVE